ncbi:helix-turn-helix domain-containing protein [Actinopolyspora halophila]|uniref:helix-turn-helix domain-containing protein n=1 Tax=Actinopolyspora halophila TaxID=1850 RepID=UPI0003703596|nr:helix-turn-helix transcriptional regulator [Actinopolyspora halophila]
MERSDPSALRWLIGNELRHYRNEAGKTAASAAQTIGCSAGKITHLETGRYQQQPDEISALLDFYGVARHDIERLTSLAASSNSHTWWAPWANVVPDWLKTFVGLEGLARSEFNYETALLPGLMQTAAYAHAATDSTGFVRPDHSERFVSFRVTRAQRLSQEDPLELHAVIEESALRRRIGDSDTRREQYRHLLELDDQPNVTTQIIRAQDGAHAGVSGPFFLLHFNAARPIVYNELLEGAVYLQNPDQVSTYTMAAKNLQEVAMQPEDSRALVEELLHD